jgi:NAD(P)-dependent dehydrogenase (short-subunit alcohol dehydrogenase family)
MIYVRGADSAIAQALNELHPISPVKRGERMPGDADRYLFCVGRILQKSMKDQTLEEVAETLEINYANVTRECSNLLDINPTARICVVGSESAFKGSFDEVYALAKLGLHNYVERKRLKYPGQQLICVAPTCIENTNMNRQRNEDGRQALLKRKLLHPKKRWLQPIEVARMIHFLLCVDEGYTTNVVIRMNGGEHCV